MDSLRYYVFLKYGYGRKEMKIFVLLNKLFPKPPVHTEDDDRRIVNRIIKRHATGSISLSKGRYVTKKDIERRKAQLQAYDF